MGTARAEDPGQSEAKEAAEAVPTESVRSKRKSTAYLDSVLIAPAIFLLGFSYSCMNTRINSVINNIMYHPIALGCHLIVFIRVLLEKCKSYH